MTVNVEKVENTVRESVNDALDQADELLKKAAEVGGEDAKVLQEQAQECLSSARKNFSAYCEKAAAEGRVIAENVNDYVHDNPWKAVGIAALAGIAIGALLSRK